jgi:hypothetical protein
VFWNVIGFDLALIAFLDVTVFDRVFAYFGHGQHFSLQRVPTALAGQKGHAPFQ